MLLVNYIKTAWRNLIGHKLYSAINILGLAIGLAACMMIALFVRDELSYDSFWKNADNIYRSDITFSVPSRAPIHFALNPGPVLHALKKDFPQVEHAARIASENPTITNGDDVFVESTYLVDAEILDIFDFNVISGDIHAALADNSSIVLNQTIARKYFGDSDPIGQVLNVDFDNFIRDYKVAAVIEDLPRNSHVVLPAMVLIDEKDWKDKPWILEAWFSVNSQLYYTLKDGTPLNEITSQLTDFIDRNFPASAVDKKGYKVSDMITLSQHNIKDIHLNAFGVGDPRELGNKETVTIFSSIAALILIIASINFMNLSTARASQRAKEVSLRKVVGASRKNIITQFLGESVLLTIIGLIIALALVEISLPSYNQVLGKELFMDYASVDILVISALALFVGLIGGLYPAFVLSSYRPAAVLKANKSAESASSVKLRGILVIIQFAVSIGLFVSTSVVYGQMLYVKNIDPGFNKSNLLVINEMYRDPAHEKRDVLIKEIERNPQVSSLTWSDATPGSTSENNTSVRTQDMPSSDSMLIGRQSVGYDYFKTYEIPIIAGRTYDRNRNDIQATTEAIREGKGHRSGIIVNESALARLGIDSASAAIGTVLFSGAGNPEENLEREFEIIGVIPDVHFRSLKQTIRPEIYSLSAAAGNSLSIRYTGNPVTLIADIETLWKQEVPAIPFSSSYVETNLDEQYQSEEGEAAMFAAFSALAIIVACLGLYGLASFTAERRTKEIGIRKVMGATIFDVVKLLIWQFSKPVAIANIIAWPVAFYVMSGWLESFVYRIESLAILAMCVVAGIAALIIAWITVAGNSIKVAKSNPIKALRYE